MILRIPVVPPPGDLRSAPTRGAPRGGLQHAGALLWVISTDPYTGDVREIEQDAFGL